MKVLPFKIQKTSAVLTQIDEGSYFYDILHKHPEYQVTFISKGSGTLIPSISLWQPEAKRLELDYYAIAHLIISKRHATILS